MRIRRAVIAVGVVASVLAVPAPTWAAGTCDYDAATHALTVTVGVDSVATLRRDGAALSLDGDRCGDATVTDVDTVVAGTNGASGGEELRLDLRGGPLAPGFTDEPGDTDEIEVALPPSGFPHTLRRVGVTYGDGADAVELGPDLVSLDGDDGDSEIDTTNIALSLDLGGGDDTVSAPPRDGWHMPSLTVDGGAGADVIAGTGNADELAGGAGDDRLEGGDAGDRLDGGPGDDVLVGGPADARIDGSDRLTGGPGNDRLDGGPGGSDTVDYRTASGDVTVDLATGVAAADGYGGTDVLAGFEDVWTGDGDDVVTGDDGVNWIDTGGGADIVVAAGGGDRVLAEAGDDRVDGGEGDDELSGGPGNDRLTGGGGADALAPEGGDDGVDGGPGRDALQLGEDRSAVVDLTRETITFRDGSAVEPAASIEDVTTQAPHDLLLGSGGPNRLEASGAGSVLRGGGGDDDLHAGYVRGEATFDYSDSRVPIRVEGHRVQDGSGGVDTVDGQGRLVGSDLGDVITYDGPIDGGDGDDLLTGGARNDGIVGGAGADVIHGAEGDDYLDGGPGADTIDGGPDHDVLEFTSAREGVTVDLAAGVVADDGSGSADVVAGVESVSGTTFADELTGDDGANVIRGGGGADLVRGAGGDDELWAEAGALIGGPGADRLVTLGTATASYADSPSAVTVDVHRVEDGFGTVDQLSADVQHIIGSPFADRFTSPGTEVRAGAGDDEIFVANEIDAGPGHDVIHANDRSHRYVDVADGERDDVECGEDSRDVVLADPVGIDEVGDRCTTVSRQSESEPPAPSSEPPAPDSEPPAPDSEPPAPASAASPPASDSPGPPAAAQPGPPVAPAPAPRPARAAPRLRVRRHHNSIDLRATVRMRVVVRFTGPHVRRVVHRIVGRSWVRLRAPRGTRHIVVVRSIASPSMLDKARYVDS